MPGGVGGALSDGRPYPYMCVLLGRAVYPQ